MTISAKILCDSVNAQGNRLTTFEVEYPRIIHSEMMTHRMFSRNAASSRAIPFDKMQEQLTGIPSRFGAAQKGMQDDGATYKYVVYNPVDSYPLGHKEAWNEAKEIAVDWSRAFKNAGYHKQIYNRLTEPFQTIKVIISATEFDNFFWLRDDVMADPTIAELARKMKEAYDGSVPDLLEAGEWHLPYVFVDFAMFGGKLRQFYFLTETRCMGENITLEEAIKVSCARCAAVSYRNEDYGLEKCLELYERLVGSDKLHASALEHCATPIASGDYSHTNKPVNTARFRDTWEKGVSHMDQEGNLWSGNFKGWVQYRKTIDDECYKGELK